LEDGDECPAREPRFAPDVLPINNRKYRIGVNSDSRPLERSSLTGPNYKFYEDDRLDKNPEPVTAQ
jgi:hypothetical protein